MLHCRRWPQIACVVVLFGSIAPADEAPSKKGSAPSFVGTKAGQVRDDNSLKMKLVWCPPGRFKMGDGDSAVDVTLTKGFWLGQTEVTQSQWQRVMQTTPWKGDDLRVKEGDDYPAAYVSYDDAIKFCEKLTDDERRAGRLPVDWKYTLPTEAQWEYACRAGTRTQFSFGDDESDLGDYGWFGGLVGDGNAKNEQYAHQVGLKKANPWNLYDIHGNVWEWCRDWYDAKPAGGSDPEGPSSGSYRVLRGGSWYSQAVLCRSADRDWRTPDFRPGNLGFRLARSPSSN